MTEANIKDRIEEGVRCYVWRMGRPPRNRGKYVISLHPPLGAEAGMYARGGPGARPP